MINILDLKKVIASCAGLLIVTSSLQANANSFSPSSDWHQSGGTEPVTTVKKTTPSPVDMIAWCTAIQPAHTPIEIQIGLINRSDEVFYDCYPYFANEDFDLTAIRDGKPFEVTVDYPVRTMDMICVPGNTDIKKPNEVTDKSFSIKGLESGDYSITIALRVLVGTDLKQVRRTVNFKVDASPDLAKRTDDLLYQSRLGRFSKLHQETDQVEKASVIRELLKDLKSDDLQIALTAVRVLNQVYYHSDEKQQGISEALVHQSKKDKSRADVHYLLTRLDSFFYNPSEEASWK